MLIHFDSTAIHIYDVKEEFKTETVLLKANGIFLNLSNEPIRVHLHTSPKQTQTGTSQTRSLPTTFGKT